MVSYGKNQGKVPLTSRLGSLIVSLTDQFPVLHQIKLIPCVQLSRTHEATEAVHVIDIVLSTTYYFCRRDTFFTTRTFSAEPPGDREIQELNKGTHEATETVHVIDIVLSTTYYLCRWDAFLTTCAFSAEPPGEKSQ